MSSAFADSRLSSTAALMPTAAPTILTPMTVPMPIPPNPNHRCRFELREFVGGLECGGDDGFSGMKFPLSCGGRTDTRLRALSWGDRLGSTASEPSEQMAFE